MALVECNECGKKREGKGDNQLPKGWLFFCGRPVCQDCVPPAKYGKWQELEDEYKQVIGIIAMNKGD